MIALLAVLLAGVAPEQCRAVDGDTIRCGSERVRLLGIDAPEIGACRAGRVCAPGDPRASSANLTKLIAGGVTIERVGVDRYGRTLALVSSAVGDLSCAQLRDGAAIYKPRWDNGGRVRSRCPSVAR